MEAGTEQKRKPGTFVKGDPRINRMTGPRSKKPRPFPLLMDMRAVYEQDESQDRGPAQKALRKMFKESTDGFLARLGRLEQAYQAKTTVEKESVEPEEEVDQGHENAMAAVGKCLERFHAKEAQENAEFAKRPDAAQIGATLQNRLAESLERQAAMQQEIDQLRRRA